MQQQSGLQLPDPDADSQAHTARVTAYLRSKIAAAGGQISFAEYMHEALYAPGLGYYSAGSTKFGAAGDFVTAPEVSPVFGAVLARQCATVIAGIDGASILEFGAGSGRLAVDVLRTLARLETLPERYRIVEVSADLRERQESLLNSEIPELVERVNWLDGLPGRHAGVVIANEVLDALPVERFVRRADGVYQACVALAEDRFVWTERPATDALAAAVVALEDDIERELPDGFTSEICLAAAPWIAAIGAMIDEGIAFLFDYGVNRHEYYAADRSTGWLRCHFRHHAHNDALILTGIQDLTSWVDFSMVATAAHDNGFEIAGFVNQAQFLMAGGLDAELADIAELPPAAQLELSRQVKLLTLPGEMGENFKCLGLRRGDVTTPGAFLVADRTTTL